MVDKHGLYMVVPSIIEKNKNEIFQMLEDGVREKKIKDGNIRSLFGVKKNNVNKISNPSYTPPIS